MIHAIAGLLFPILDFLYAVTHSWGWSIILFAFLARVFLIPLTNKQFRSMKEMQAIQPEIKRLQDRYKDKPQVFQKEFQALLKSRKVNPFSGCLLSMVIQLPILWAIFYVIRDHIAKFGTSGFLWIGSTGEKLAAAFPSLFNSLSDWRGLCQISMHGKASFPFLGTSLAVTDWPLLILYGLSMIFYSKLNSPPNPDPQAQQMSSTMNLMMPIMSVLIFSKFPSAFILYWLVFNVFSVIHQYWFTKIYEAQTSLPQAREKATLPAAGEKRRNNAHA